MWKTSEIRRIVYKLSEETIGKLIAPSFIIPTELLNAIGHEIGGTMLPRPC